ncbi:hypothetical protein [Nakamurella antarctica]|nr:hypothetical protein [Nakamurella antarctica]
MIDRSTFVAFRDLPATAVPVRTTRTALALTSACLYRNDDAADSRT